jgi:diguanylate cyclase (GGDEF)-like protein
MRSVWARLAGGPVSRPVRRFRQIGSLLLGALAACTSGGTWILVELVSLEQGSQLAADASARNTLVLGFGALVVVEIGLIALLAFVVLPALGRTSAAAELEIQERKQVRYMMEMIQCISSRAELTTTLGIHLGRILPDLSGSVHLFSPSRDVVEQVGSWGDVPTGVDDIPLADCWGLRLGKAYGSFDGRHVICQHVPETLHGHWCFPMLADGDAVGMFHVRAKTPVGVVTEQQRERASQLAEGLAITLANMRLRETLRNQSIRDPLTGVFNRRYMEESLTRELRRAARRGHPVSVVMIDLDHFKVLNDTFGHAVGDELLCAFGRFLTARSRAEDIVCRYGGEEFVLIFPDMSATDATAKTEFFRDEWAGHSVNNGNGGRVSAPFSAGTATFPHDATSTEAIIAAADSALYAAKSRGRDRVVSATEEPGLRRVTPADAPAKSGLAPARQAHPTPVVLERAS